MTMITVAMIIAAIIPPAIAPMGNVSGPEVTVGKKDEIQHTILCGRNNFKPFYSKVKCTTKESLYF